MFAVYTIAFVRVIFTIILIPLAPVDFFVNGI